MNEQHNEAVRKANELPTEVVKKAMALFAALLESAAFKEAVKTTVMTAMTEELRQSRKDTWLLRQDEVVLKPSQQ